MPDDDGENGDDDEGFDDNEATNLDDSLSDAVGEERQDDGSRGLIEAMKSIFGSDFSEADIDQAIHLIEGKIRSEGNSI